MENNIYSNEEFLNLVKTMEGIQSYIPENLAGYVWNNYKHISGSNENTPCMCSSASGLWIKAANTIRDYIKTNSDKYNA